MSIQLFFSVVSITKYRLYQLSNVFCIELEEINIKYSVFYFFNHLLHGRKSWLIFFLTAFGRLTLCIASELDISLTRPKAIIYQESCLSPYSCPSTFFCANLLRHMAQKTKQSHVIQNLHFAYMVCLLFLKIIKWPS